jgi:hypothetical protein
LSLCGEFVISEITQVDPMRFDERDQ